MHSAKGFTFVELLFATGLIAVLDCRGGAATSRRSRRMADAGAVRYLSGRLYQARMEAAVRNADTAVRFVQAGSTLRVRHRRRRQPKRRPPLGRPGAASTVSFTHGERLADKFAGVDFGALPGLPPWIRRARRQAPTRSDWGPTTWSRSRLSGSSSPGSLYIRGRGNVQYVLRVFAETGKIRMLKFYPGSRQWKQL